MDAARWERLQAVFHAALDRPVEERRGWVEAALADSPDLIPEVLAMLAADERGAPLLDEAFGDLAGRVLSEPAGVPRSIGHYRILGVLGEGGMGIVYLAERPDLGHRVAIKVLRDATLSRHRRERFAGEQRTLARLTHPSIARLYDADTLPDGTPYIVMERVEGEPLTSYCVARGAGLRDRLAIFREVCEAVQYAHRHAIVHRDLKPSNILVTREGSVRLLDFGIAKQLDAGEVNATRTALRLMTPAYAAPEQVRGEPVGIHTDIYALGVILYELLCDVPPFEVTGRSPGQVESLILEHEPERPSAAAHRRSGPPLARAGEWADLDVLCLTAMHKEPSRRYPTADALVRDIEHFLAGEPLDARPDGVGYRVAKHLRRNWKVVSAAAAVLLAIAGLTGFYALRLTAARDAAVAEAARTRSIQRFVLNLFEGGAGPAAPADSLRVVAMLERGLDEARVLDGEPELQAELFVTLGAIQHKLGDLERADSLLQTALRMRRALHGERHSSVAETLVALGELRTDQARLEDAESLIEEALAAGRDLSDDHPAMVRARIALGTVLQARGEYDRSAEVLERVVGAEARRPGPDLTEALAQLANTKFYAGDYATSDSLNRLVLALNRQIHGERHPSVADALINLGAIQFQRGNYVEAEPHFREALDLKTAYYGRDHPEIGSSLTLLGRALVFQERTAEAVEILGRALAIQERVYGPGHPSVASILNELGIVALTGDDLAEAERNFRRMAEIYRAVHGDTHLLVATAVSNLGSVYIQAEDYPAAERYMREAVDIFSRALPEGHLSIGIAQIKLGRTLVRQRRWAEAEPLLLAGRDAVGRQSNSQVSWLRAARTDLVEVYDALGRPAEAERFRVELAERASAGEAR